VIEVLEAVHLLLAVRLFVVVVAVDPRWLLRAVAVHYRELLDSRDPAAGGDRPADPSIGDTPGGEPPSNTAGEEPWGTPAQYLEKIFQIPFTLPPLDSAGYNTLVDWLVGPSESPQSPQRESDQPPAVIETPSQVTNISTGVASRGDEGDDAKMELPAPRVVDRLDPMHITEDERRFMQLLGPPLITTPRSVKRFTNSYGFLNALRGERRLRDTQGVPDLTTGELYYPHRAALALLATLIGFPSLSPDLFLQIHDQASRWPGRTWGQLVDQLAPERAQEVGRWTSACFGPLEPESARQWAKLTSALRNLESEAARKQMGLPVPLSAWAEWVVDVGRLSFQTGHVVTHLGTEASVRALGRLSRWASETTSSPRAAAK
jgi:hypothetical protein